jgi:hypothetical protein
MGRAVRALLSAAAAVMASVLSGFGVDVAVAHAGPQCQFLGKNYNVWYPCDQYQPWLPYGTANNPPLSGPPLGDCSDPMKQHNQACWRP